MKRTINDRIRALMDHYNLNPNAFAGEISVAAPAIYNIVGGRMNRPSYEVLQKIKKRFPEANMNWVIDGTGSINLDDPPKPQRSHGIPVITSKDIVGVLDSGDYSGAVGYAELPGAIIGEGEMIIAQHRGDDMHPIIQDGGWGIFAKHKGGIEDGVYLVYSAPYGVQVRHVEILRGGAVLLKSENDTHASTKVNVNEIKQLWSWRASIHTKSDQGEDLHEMVKKLNLELAEIKKKLNK